MIIFKKMLKLKSDNEPWCIFCVLIIFILSGIGALSFAIFFEIFYGYKPCYLCTLQRVPYFILIVISFFALIRPIYVLVILSLAGVVIFSSMTLAFFHLGVEQLWWSSTAYCSSEFTTDISIAELRRSLLEKPVPACDKVGWNLFGISMAGYNLIFSCGLMAICLFGLYRFVGRKN